MAAGFYFSLLTFFFFSGLPWNSNVSAGKGTANFPNEKAIIANPSGDTLFTAFFTSMVDDVMQVPL